MPINPAIALGVEAPKPVDYLGAYGNALSLKNLVNQGRAQELQLAQAQREQEKQIKLSDLARASGGDMERFAAGMGAIDPIGALDYGMKAKQLQMQQRKAALEQADGFNKLFLGSANAVKAAGYSQDVYNAELQRLRALGVPEDMLANVPAQVSPQYIDANIQAGMSNADRLAREKEEFDRMYPGELGKALYAQEQYRQQTGRMMEGDGTQTTGAGGVDPVTGEVRAPTVNVGALRTPFDPVIARMQQGNENQPFLRDPSGKIVPNQPVQDFETTKAEASATRVNQFNNTKDDFENERKLRNDFKTEPIYKAHQEVKTAYGQIGSSLKLESPAGDLAAATKIMKLLDPTSVVRESELGMAMAATGLEDRLSSLATNIIRGTKLTPAQRKDFRKLADEIYLISEKEYSAKRSEYMDTAKAYGLSADRVGGREKPAAMGSQGNPYKIKGDDGYNALPSGSFYTGPDGVVRQKP